MIANKIITKDRVAMFFNKMLINKDYNILFMYLFFYVRNIELHEKILFLLYNEYVTLDQVVDIVKTDPKIGSVDYAGYKYYTDNSVDITTLSSRIEEKLQLLINGILSDNHMSLYSDNYIDAKASNLPYSAENTYYILTNSKYIIAENVTKDDYDGTTTYYIRERNDTSYRFIRNCFFRDHVTTLTYKNYKDASNMNDQLEIVYNALSDVEKSFLKTELDIDATNFSILVREQTANNKIDLAYVERYNNSNKIKDISALLNNNALYGSDTKQNIFLSILNKISIGTIH